MMFEDFSMGHKPAVSIITGLLSVFAAQSVAQSATAGDALLDFKRFSLGGRLILENAEARFAGDSFDESELRQFRIRPTYDFSKDLRLRAAFELSDSKVELPNVFLEWRQENLRLRFGQAKIITGLDVASSRLAISFINRPAIVELASGLTRQLGVAARYRFGDFVYHGGIYHSAVSDGGSQDAFNFASRLVWTHGNADGSRLHFGGAFRYRSRSDADSFRYRLRVETRALPRLIRSERFSEEDMLFSGEFLYQKGPLTLNGEALYLKGGDSESSGVYGDISWFFGGKRGYQKANARLELSDVRNGILNGGVGAFEVAFRLDYARLQDDGFDSQKQFSQELALIWHLERNIRFVTNVIHTRAGIDGNRQTVKSLNLSLQFSI
jgi:phosphate-selective porin OprO/OprP